MTSGICTTAWICAPCGRPPGDVYHDSAGGTTNDAIATPISAPESGNLFAGSATPAVTIDLQRLLGDAEAARVLAAAGSAFDMTRFDERLTLLERTLSSTLNALGQLLGAAQAQRDAKQDGGVATK